MQIAAQASHHNCACGKRKEFGGGRINNRTMTSALDGPTDYQDRHILGRAWAARGANQSSPTVRNCQETDTRHERHPQPELPLRLPAFGADQRHKHEGAEILDNQGVALTSIATKTLDRAMPADRNHHAAALA